MRIGLAEKWLALLVVTSGLVTIPVNVILTVISNPLKTNENSHGLPNIVASTGDNKHGRQWQQQKQTDTTTRSQTSSHYDGTGKNIAPMLQILSRANMTIPFNRNDPLYENLFQKLPDWQQVVDRFGSGPVILGLDRCQEFNAKTPSKYRAMGPAGPFNSGTNFLHTLLKDNCYIPPPEGRKKHSMTTGGERKGAELCFCCY